MTVIVSCLQNAREPKFQTKITIKVEHNPHPMAAAPSQRRGGNSFDVTVAGTWHKICFVSFPELEERRGCIDTHIGEVEGRRNPVEKFASRVAVQRILRQALQPRVSQIRPIEDFNPIQLSPRQNRSCASAYKQRGTSNMRWAKYADQACAQASSPRMK